MQNESQHWQSRAHLMIASVESLLEDLFHATARGGEIAFMQIEQHPDHGQTAQEPIVAEFHYHALGFIKLGRGQGVIASEQCMTGLMEEGKRQPGRVVERALNAFAFSQIAGSLGRV